MLFIPTLTVLASLASIVTAHAIKLRPFFEKAVVILNGEKTNGTVFFNQEKVNGPVQITGVITGLSANAKHGFHVHQYGNLTAGCASAGGHFNPYNQTHGAPTALVRHVGDLGNLETDGNGVATLNFTDNVISLNGINSIIGRGVVVHAGTDDLGLGGNADSLTTGNAGARAACGVVGLA